MKGRIIYRLVNRERNRKLLEDVPYKEYLDLAIVYYVLLEMDEYGMASMMVRREHLKMWKVSEEDIYYRACKNTQKYYHMIFDNAFCDHGTSGNWKRNRRTDGGKCIF